MFGFLKDKIKGAVDKISKKAEEEAPEKIIEVEVQPVNKPQENPKKKKKTKKKEPTKKKEKLSKEKPKTKKEVVKEAKEEIAKEIKEKVKEEVKEKKGLFSGIKDKFKKKEDLTEEEQEKVIEIVEKTQSIKDEEKNDIGIRIEENVDLTKQEAEKVEEAIGKEEKKGFFGKLKQKVVTKKISEEKFEELFWELELALLENNVAVEVINKIKEDLKVDIVDVPITKSHIDKKILESLKDSLSDVLKHEKVNLLDKIKEKKPYVICFIGINGSGKTTSIARVAHLLKEKGLTPVIAAADTFRAASIEQLDVHGKNLDVKIIKHDYGSDAAAVAFDSIKHAEAKGKDVVLIDTAGRLHSNKDLLDELNKIIKVAKPDMKIFVGESITGNDAVNQAQEFNKSVGIDAIILTKADIDEKGGAAISVSYVTGKPIIYIGVGQEYADLKEFKKEEILENLGF